MLRGIFRSAAMAVLIAIGAANASAATANAPKSIMTASSLHANGVSTWSDPATHAAYYLKVMGAALGLGAGSVGVTTPLPPALLLFGSGLAGLLALGRRSRRRAAAYS